MPSAPSSMSRRPVVGICAAIERARWAAWDIEVNLSPRTYSRAVAGAGAQPLILPPTEQMADAPEEALELLDGLVVAGGSDIDPASYGAAPDERTAGARPERDAFEVALIRAALDADLPVLAVCRGMQVLNVALGGDLIQHLETAATHVHTPGTFSDHEVALQPGSLAARAAGAELVSVRSHHHQGIGELGSGLVVTGRSVSDDVIEAIELTDRSFALGILWHPEEEERSPVIGAFVAATMAEVAS